MVATFNHFLIVCSNNIDNQTTQIWEHYGSTATMAENKQLKSWYVKRNEKEGISRQSNDRVIVNEQIINNSQLHQKVLYAEQQDYGL
jgi:hypothetical protein